MKDAKNKIFIGVSFPILLAILTILFFILNQNSQLKTIGEEIKQTNNTIDQLSALYQKALRHSLTNRTFSVGANKKVRDSIQITATILLQQLHTVKECFSNRTDVKKDLDSLNYYVHKRIEFSNRMLAIADGKGLQDAYDFLHTGVGSAYNRKILFTSNQLQAKELLRLQHFQDKLASSIQKITIYVFGVVISALILLLVLLQKTRLYLAAKKQSEKQLQNFNHELQKQVSEKTATLTQILARITDAFIALDNDGRCVYVNNKAAQMLGVDASVLSGKHLLTEVPELQGHFFSKMVQEAMTNELYHHQEYYDKQTNRRFEFYFYPSPEGLSFFFHDITGRKNAEQAITDSYKQVRLLTEHLQNIREEERTNIAREIHDELGQQLTVIKMDVSWLNKKLAESDPSVKEKLADLISLINHTVQSVRRIAAELRPSLLDDLGLGPAMEWHLNEFEKRSGIKTNFTGSEEEQPLPMKIKTNLFRIFQESLTNTAKHAQATEINVELVQESNQLTLTITDNGCGFEQQMEGKKNTLGILGMKERTAMMGGTYEIRTAPGKGTKIFVDIPLSS